MKDLFLKFAFAITLLYVCSCGKISNEPNHYDIPEIIELDFNNRYPNVSITDFTQWDHDNSAKIYFTDTNGLLCTAIYLNEDWMLTQREFDTGNFLSQLPREVERTYTGTGVNNEKFDGQKYYVVEITRSGIDHKQYEFNFTAPYDDGVHSYTNLSNNMVIDENGVLLTHRHASYNPSIWSYDIRESIQCVINKYPSAKILGSINDGGNNIFFILDNKILKSITTRRNINWEWEETKYQLDINTIVPETVIADKEAYETEHPGSKFYALYYIENKCGTFYGLVFGDKFYNTTILSKIE